MLPMTTIRNVPMAIMEKVTYITFDLPSLSARMPPPKEATGRTYWAARVTIAPAVAAMPKREVA